MKKLFLLLGLIFPVHAERVALCIMATGKYLPYAENLIASAQKYFCTEHDVTYFLFTDGCVQKDYSNLETFYQERLGWPYDTLMRFHTYYQQKELLQHFDYVYACDADMLFVASVGREIFSERVATKSPAWHWRHRYEKNMRSTAFVPAREGKYYLAGGFYGGTAPEFLRFMEYAIESVDRDLSWGYIAEVHDESHLNCYFYKNPPTLILSAAFCYPSNLNVPGACWSLPKEKYLLSICKDHAAMRSN